MTESLDLTFELAVLWTAGLVLLSVLVSPLATRLGAPLLLIFVARPLAVALCLAPFRYSHRERLFIAWVGLRGAVPIFLAIIPVASTGPVDVNFFSVVFLVVIASLVIQGWMIPWLARRLDLEADPQEPSTEAAAELRGARSQGTR